MRPILAIPVLAFALGAASSAAPPAGLGQPPHCKSDGTMHLARPGNPGQVHKLTDLPPARAYYPMVDRGADGCITPVLYGTRSGVARIPGTNRAPIVPRTFP